MKYRLYICFVRDKNVHIQFCCPLSSQALQKGNLEGARIHAENAIRQKNQVSLYSTYTGLVAYQMSYSGTTLQ